MKLEGSLDAFGLPDIFQLLSFTKKTGGLHLQGGDVQGVVYFAAGSVTGACSDTDHLTLVRRLVGSGTVSDASLEAAVARATADDIGVTRALSDAGAVDPELLREAATEQAVDSIYDLLRWPAGDFAFSVDEPNPDDVGVLLPTDRVVSEAQSRTTAFDQALALVPTDAVLVMPVVLAEDPSLTRDEWALIALVDSRRTVAEIVELTGAGLFAVLSTLADLVRRNLLAVKDPMYDHATVVRRRLDLLAPLEGVNSSTRAATAVELDVSPDAVAAEQSQPDPTAAAARADAVPVAQPAATAAEDSSIVHRNGSTPKARSSFTLGTNPQSGAIADPKRNDERLGSAAVPATPPVSAPAVASSRAVPPAAAPEPDTVVPLRAPAASNGAQAPATSSGATRLGIAPDPFRGTDRAAAPVSRNHGAVASNGSPNPAGPAPAARNAANGSAAVAAEPAPTSVIERDPSVNRSLLLRLIAGVRGL